MTQPQADDLARSLKVTADPARLRLLSIIAASESQEACVCDLTEPLDIGQPTDAGLQLLENAVATALGPAVLIMLIAPLSGAHFNPVVSLVESACGLRSWCDTAFYIPAQVIECILGAMLANALFGDAAVSVSSTERLTPPHFLSEIVATTALIMVIFVLAHAGRSGLTAAAVGAYIGAAHFFTISTSFANPALTIGRMFSDTFAGIVPSSAPGFVAAQLIGAALGFALVRWFYPGRRIDPGAK